MYHYIVDPSRLPVRNFDRTLGEVYGHLTEHQISGEVHRITRLRNMHELVESALSSGAKTLVAMGDDETFQELLQIIAGKKDIVLGFLPLVKNSVIASVLGLGSLEDACRAIAQRRTEQFDLGQINRNYFFTDLSFGLQAGVATQGGASLFGALKTIGRVKAAPLLPLIIDVDGRYKVSLNASMGMVVNTPSRIPSAVSSGLDDKLDLLLLGKLSVRELLRYRGEFARGELERIPGVTVLHGERFEIDAPKNTPIFSQNLSVGRLPVTINLSEHKLRLIIGKNFAV